MSLAQRVICPLVLPRVVLTVAGLAGLLPPKPTLQGQRPPAPSYHVAAITAFLYDNRDGTFSENVIQNESAHVSGPNENSDGTLVVVELQGKGRSYESGRRVQLVARERGKVTLSRALELGVFSDSGRWYAGFWLYGTRCAPLELRARVVGQADTSSVGVVAPFNCGAGTAEVLPARGTPHAAAPYAITAVRAFLFGRTFSDNVVAESEPTLWNEMHAETFVVVEIHGGTGSPPSGRKVQLVASEGSKVALDMTLPMRALSEDGRYFAGFWVYANGCELLTLKARIIGLADSAVVKQLVPFACGE